MGVIGAVRGAWHQCSVVQCGTASPVASGASRRRFQLATPTLTGVAEEAY
jgi:hypothetical protein